MSGAELRRRPGGRSARVRQAVLDATLDLVSEHGVEGLTVSGVADRAGVHESSIYRRWGTRENVIIDALLSASEEFLPVPDSGSLRRDLIAFATSLDDYLRTPLGGALISAFALHASDPAMVAARERFWDTRTSLASEMLTRAVQRGEVRPNVDPALALESLVAPVYFRVLFTRAPADASFTARLVELLLEGLETPQASSLRPT